ncbi:hypothetical protein [Anaerorhabdus sp.]|uniref:hypothetical protein n=1 Tax=Anaerorhabdus sp. TaxID=1872524 RepID=UPI002B1FA48E|nr:hypothetical protein [Anaerorhabdus sp.]MEA4875669.1 hypothetical protein [Anaerorhabdus sp.]
MLITVDEIMNLFGISKASAYRIIVDLNQSLKEKGYRTVHGKTSRKFFYENYYLNRMEDYHNVRIQR